jgi:putative chitinase
MRLDQKYKTLFNSYQVNTTLRIAHFLAQAEHESGLKPIAENLNYSAKGLSTTFRRYFPTPQDTLRYERKPQLIANKVYANRMGNGSEDTGEGWRYRGRGFFQITGKNNYLVLSKDARIDCFNNPDLLLEEPNALISALWYWNKHKLNDLADKDDLDAISDIINIGHSTVKEGDSNGYLHRKELLLKWKKLIK